MTRFAKSLTLALAAMMAFGTAASAEEYDKKEKKEKGTIVKVAREAGTFKTLLAAAVAADLAETLSGEGPFTVLAPTDEAFAKLPEGTVKGLLEKPEELKKILLHHVIAGKVMSSDVVKLTEAESMLGQKLSIDASDGVVIGGAKVIKADVSASNGVIHVIDTVILPAAE
jgi:uncharacterized surface protein with fasciclin (FAS1) repeats